MKWIGRCIRFSIPSVAQLSEIRSHFSARSLSLFYILLPLYVYILLYFSLAHSSKPEHTGLKSVRSNFYSLREIFRQIFLFCFQFYRYVSWLVRFFPYTADLSAHFKRYQSRFKPAVMSRNLSRFGSNSYFLDFACGFP